LRVFCILESKVVVSTSEVIEFLWRSIEWKGLARDRRIERIVGAFGCIEDLEEVGLAVLVVN